MKIKRDLQWWLDRHKQLKREAKLLGGPVLMFLITGAILTLFFDPDAILFLGTFVLPISIIIEICTLVNSLKYRFRQGDELIKHGQKQQALIHSVHIGTRVVAIVNDDEITANTYRVIGRVKFNGADYKVQSRLLHYNPSRYIKIGMAIPCYIDEKMPSEYYLDFRGILPGYPGSMGHTKRAEDKDTYIKTDKPSSAEGDGYRLL